MSDEMQIDELKEPNDRFLHALDLVGPDDLFREYTLTIKAVHPPGTFKQMGADGRESGQPIPHYVIEFAKAKKMLVLTSKINRMRLRSIHGLHLGGKSITLYAVEGMWFRQHTLGIRIRVPAGVPMRKEDRNHVGRDLTGTKVGAAT